MKTWRLAHANWTYSIRVWHEGSCKHKMHTDSVLGPLGGSPDFDLAAIKNLGRPLGVGLLKTRTSQLISSYHVQVCHQGVGLRQTTKVGLGLG